MNLSRKGKKLKLFRCGNGCWRGDEMKIKIGTSKNPYEKKGVSAKRLLMFWSDED